MSLLHPIDIHVIGQDQAHLLDRVAEDVFDGPVQADLLARYLSSPDSLLVVALAEGCVVGMASGLLYLHPDKPLQLFVNEVGVADRLQRLGIGRRLVQALLAEARRRGCREAWVATEVDNLAARALYRATGGKEEAERAVVYTFAFAEAESD